MPLQLSEDEVDDLLYYARTGDIPEFGTLSDELCARESITLNTLLSSATDAQTGNGPLHMAAANGHTDIIRTLITKAFTLPSPQNTPNLALLNAQNASGNTPLHYAALNGHLECVKTLLDNGADPTIVNSAGHDAVYEAELGDRTEVVEWVLREGGEGLESGVGGGGGGEGEGEGDGEDGDVGEVGEEDEKEIQIKGQETGGEGSVGDDGVVGIRADDGIRKAMGGLSVKDGADHL